MKCTLGKLSNFSLIELINQGNQFAELIYTSVLQVHALLLFTSGFHKQ